MCGIFFCSCCCSGDQEFGGRTGAESNSKAIHDLLNDPILAHRGPDVSREHRLSFSSQVQSLQGWMRGCILHLRGEITPQPLTDDKGNALLWNGEIFDGIQVSRDQNDTQVLFRHLVKCQADEDVLSTLEKIKGPWAFIFWQAERKILWFGRDVFGRRSLLWHLPSVDSELLVLSSIAVGNLDYTEVPSVGIFAMDMSSVDCVGSERPSSKSPSPLPTITLHPWHNCKWPGSTQPVLDTQQHELASFLTPDKSPSIIPINVDRNQILNYWIPSMNQAVSGEDGNGDSLHEEKICEDKNGFVRSLENILTESESYRLLSGELVCVLQDAVMRRVNNLPVEKEPVCDPEDGSASKAKVAVLFSGGLDSSVIAALLDRCLPPDEPIDLLNVAFEQPPPAHNSSKPKHKKKKHGRNKPSHHQDASTNSDDAVCLGLDLDSTSRGDVHTRTDLPSCSSHNQSVVSDSFDTGQQQLKDNGVEESFNSSTTCVCEQNCEKDFSSKCQIKENSPRSSPSQSTSHDPFDVPDRRTGRIALSELNPHRKWNFIEINVSQQELQTLRSSCVARLIYPLQTVLDDSIGCAVWFAARGEGRLANRQGQHSVSKAKVILCGMAADELFGGYSRHRAHFYQHGEESLMRELEKDIWRISARNLGRDDRIIADHGKEARFPFLDESFLEFVSRIPVHVRADLRLPRGLGEKLLLRLSAFTLGLRQTACQPKRAIQFGSKIAKLDNSKEKGSDICQRLV